MGVNCFAKAGAIRGGTIRSKIVALQFLDIRKWTRN
jgi:hypothetical protein